MRLGLTNEILNREILLQKEYWACLMKVSSFPRLVVVLVSMNNPESLQITLDSLKNLKYPNTILINVDSSDNHACEEILKYSQFENRYFWEEKQGIYHAMNSALDLVQGGDIIWFLNPGDVLNDSKLLQDIMVSFHDYPEVDFIYAQAQEIANSDPFKVFPGNNVEASVKNLCDGTFRISHQALLVRQSIMGQVHGFDTRYQIAADLKLEFQLLSNYKGRFVPGVLVHFDGGGISHNRILRTLFESACVRYLGGHLSFIRSIHFLVKSIFLKVKNRILRKVS
jgi:glycosyltransferase involved in cell wall biosynthesis